jgi:non-ribosomal peptide synthetase component F
MSSYWRLGSAPLQVLLSRHTAQDDIAVATPHHNRRHAEVEDVQGCFVNTLAIRISSAEDPSFQQLLQRVKAAVGGAFCHADVPFQAVAEVVAEQRGAAPIYQVVKRVSPLCALRQHVLGAMRIKACCWL